MAALIPFVGYTLNLNDPKNPEEWDLFLDASGNIATTTQAQAIAQNVANSVRLFTNDAYYDEDRGIPHFLIELTKDPQFTVLRSRIKKIAEAWEGVENCQVINLAINDKRVLTGEIRLTLFDGSTYGINI